MTNEDLERMSAGDTRKREFWTLLSRVLMERRLLLSTLSLILEHADQETTERLAKEAVSLAEEKFDP